MERYKRQSEVANEENLTLRNYILQLEANIQFNNREAQNTIEELELENKTLMDEKETMRQACIEMKNQLQQIRLEEKKAGEDDDFDEDDDEMVREPIDFDDDDFEPQSFDELQRRATDKIRRQLTQGQRRDSSASIRVGTLVSNFSEVLHEGYQRKRTLRRDSGLSSLSRLSSGISSESRGTVLVRDSVKDDDA